MGREGVAVCTSVGHQAGVELVSDGYGGAIIVWHDYRSGSMETDDVYAQRVSGSGVTQWADNGIPICTGVGHKLSLGITSDESGGAIIAWENQHSGSDSDLYAQRVSGSGVTQWADNGTAICNAPSFQSHPTLVSDCSGGAIGSWEDNGRGGIYAQRVGASGAAEWADNGIPVCTAAGSQIGVRAAGNGASGAIIAWQDGRGDDYQVCAQRIDLSGTSMWTDNGVAVCTFPSRQESPELTADGTGGAVITWQDWYGGNTDSYAQKADAAGTLLWAETGVAVCTAAGIQGAMRLVGDGSGGAIITWEDRRNGFDTSDIYAQRVTSSGTVEWTQDGVAICTAQNLQFSPVIAGNGAGGAIVTWQDRRNSDADDIYAQAVNAWGGLNGAAARPNQPTNVSPQDGVSNLSVEATLQSSAFSTANPGDTQNASQWRVRTSTSRYANPIFDSGTDPYHLTQIGLPLGVLSEGTAYHWQVRYQDNHSAWSTWSVETSFTTLSIPNQPPNQPRNSAPADLATGVSLTPALEWSTFSDPDFADAHAASQWQLRASTGNYSSPIYDSGRVLVPLTDITVPSGRLSHATVYYWRVRHQDNHGAWSPYSAETSFTTVAAQPPEEPGSPSGTRVTDLASAPDGSQCWAIIIGVADYMHRSPPPPNPSPTETYDLSYSDDDANELFERLRPICGEDHMKLLVDAGGSKFAIKDAILSWLAPKEGPEDTILFYFSGHGNSEYIAPYDALTTSDANYIGRMELDGWLDSLESTRLLTIVESCYSGGFVTCSQSSGRVLMASSTGAESSWETSKLGHGIFGYYLLESLQQAAGDQAHYAADANKNHRISAEEIFYYLEPRVASYVLPVSGERQHPVLYDGYPDELVLAAYRTQYYLEVTTERGNAQGAGWYDEGSEVSSSVPQLVEAGEGTQYVFASWSDGNASASRVVTVSGPTTLTANYTTQYHLTVRSDWGVPEGTGWYDSGSTASFSVASPVGTMVRHVFDGWSGDSSEAVRSATVLMDGPKTVDANWRTDYAQLYGIIVAGTLLAVAVPIGIIIMVRRRQARVSLDQTEANHGAWSGGAQNG